MHEVAACKEAWAHITSVGAEIAGACSTGGAAAGDALKLVMEGTSQLDRSKVDRDGPVQVGVRHGL